MSSTSMQVGSSSPTGPSEHGSQGSSAGFVSTLDHPRNAVGEQATVQIAASFIRHVLQACPPQHDTMNRRPGCLVEFSGVPRELTGTMGTGVRVTATADGELLLQQLVHGHPGYHLRPRRPALLEAKRRFTFIDDGMPVMTDEVLGQMTCEALALRLMLSNMVSEGADGTNKE